MAKPPRSTSARIVSQRLRSLAERKGRSSRRSVSIRCRSTAGSAGSPAARARAAASSISRFSRPMFDTLATAPMRPTRPPSATAARIV